MVRYLYVVMMVGQIGLLGSLCAGIIQASPKEQVHVRMDTGEAQAVLAILAKRKAHQTVENADWQRLFASEGYKRLKNREQAMGRPFTDAEFEAFVLSDSLLEKADALATTLTRWQQVDVTQAAEKSLAYLPEHAQIKARIYPLIKPKTNSFVFQDKMGRAIYLYLDPEVTPEQFENTLAHEMHHIGYSSCCPSRQTAREIAKLPPNLQAILTWLGAFGEGAAMLAAAGGPDIHPHQVSKPEDRVRWDRDMANFNTDLKKVEAFFLDILNGKLTTEAQIRQVGFTFFGIQGPWYTVGWKMDVLIEKTYGRAKLIECLCDTRKLLPTYNQAAEAYNRTASEPLALWSAPLVDALDNALAPSQRVLSTGRTKE
ncbi:MAG TPA: DUF5700 domain-containing putative Zn-dependent protease [Chthonomonadaceae bacterium]|nr:DUF5700 domain-containing putative Zn-dependent protease [Chthonomonadaceae bacterium]